jgi:multidrug efflux pump subunit AcrA (membrane-fusion protein)
MADPMRAAWELTAACERYRKLNEAAKVVCMKFRVAEAAFEAAEADFGAHKLNNITYGVAAAELQAAKTRYVTAEERFNATVKDDTEYQLALQTFEMAKAKYTRLQEELDAAMMAAAEATVEAYRCAELMQA